MFLYPVSPLWWYSIGIHVSKCLIFVVWELVGTFVRDTWPNVSHFPLPEKDMVNEKCYKPFPDALLMTSMTSMLSAEELMWSPHVDLKHCLTFTVMDAPKAVFLVFASCFWSNLLAG